MASLLQRKLKKIVLFCLSSVSLKPSSVWKPDSDALSENFIDFDIPSFFGVVPQDYYANDMELKSYDLSHSQFFSSDDWLPLANALQAAQAEGRGIIHTSELTTVENKLYGIDAGWVVNVTWVYLGRLSAWESELSPEMQALVVPPTDSENMGNTIASGPFAQFPHYATMEGALDYRQANLLADLCGWSILQNEEKWRQILSK
jgi:hypothetical protein